METVQALFSAVRKADEQAIERLVTEGVNLNSTVSGQTPLILAIQQGSVPIVRLLLQLGANGNGRTGFDGLTPLHVCARIHGSASIAAMGLLLSKGASVNARTTRRMQTPLHVSVGVFGFFQENAQFLIENGANVHLADRRGETPLYHAIKDPSMYRETSYRGQNRWVLQKNVIKLLLDNDASTFGIQGLDWVSDDIKAYVWQNQPVDPDISILQKTEVDVITQEEKTVLEHLEEDPRNFVIEQKGHVALTNIETVHTAMDQAIAYPCHLGNSFYHEGNVDTTTEMLSLSRISHFTGYLSVASLNEAMSSVIRTNTRIFSLVRERTVISTASQTLMENRTNVVSATHCPPDSKAILYKLRPVRLEGMPHPVAISDDFVHEDMSLVIMAYTIVMNATVDAPVLNQLRSKIMEAGQSTMADPRSARFQDRVQNRILIVEGNVEIKLLLNWMHLFKPRLSGVKVTDTVPISGSWFEMGGSASVAGIDLSFLRHIVGLESFVSTNRKLNSKSVLHQLSHHAGTLKTLSIYINQSPQPTLEHFQVLRDVDLINVYH